MSSTQNSVPENVNANEIWKYLCGRQRHKILKKLKLEVSNATSYTGDRKHMKKCNEHNSKCHKYNPNCFRLHVRRLNIERARKRGDMPEMMNSRITSRFDMISNDATDGSSSGVCPEQPEPASSSQISVKNEDSKMPNQFTNMTNTTQNVAGTIAPSDEYDADKMFLLCLLPGLKQVSDIHKFELKIGLMQAMRQYMVVDEKPQIPNDNRL